ncbi:MAG: clostripain-related cysteine peptidase [Porphyromonadaceae bacterium]|nr:clostripain-related cysteine peptidase [Porphyromonadaceae bacterium]
MNKFQRIITGLLFCFPLFWGCTNDVPDPVAPTRTVLIYMAADNSLSSYSYKNIESIVQGTTKAALNGGNLVVYVDAADAAPQLLQIKVKSDGSIQKLAIKDYAEQNSADPLVMRSIFDEVRTSFPADSYGLVLWSHGTAWLPYNVQPMLRSFGQDESNWMEIDELAEALPDHVFDFIMFDACYMASTEVAYALRDKAEYILASPTEVLGEGFPYKLIIGNFFTETADLQQIAETFYNYYNQQTGLYQSASVSLIATEQLDNLAAICREIVIGKENAIASLPIQELQQLEYLGYTYHALYDFDDFISRLATEAQYTNYLSILNKVVLYKQTTPNATYAKGQLVINQFSGLSIYVPQNGLATLNDWYKGMAWYKVVYQ